MTTTTDPGESREIGPHGWANWRAQIAGSPARTDSRTSTSQVLPLWTEFALYSDAWFTGDLAFGPMELFLSFPRYGQRVGYAKSVLTLRTHDHLPDPEYGPLDLEEQDVSAYTGGDVGDEFASLMALALNRRLRSGGAVRQSFELGGLGRPRLSGHQEPFLAEPDWRPMIPGIGNQALLNDASKYLDSYIASDGAEAVALLRAAHQFADALWVADADPRIAWIKMFGALEAAANHWDGERTQDPADQLRRRHPGLYNRLRKEAPEAVEIVAVSLSRVLGAESKLLDFVLEYAPSAPKVRPEFGVFDWGTLDAAISILYDHRSRDLHGGIPFPGPLCAAPEIDNEGVAAEAFPALAGASGGGAWASTRLPMYLNTFVTIVGDSLRKWWLELGTS